jgi:hypothetical protein
MARKRRPRTAKGNIPVQVQRPTTLEELDKLARRNVSPGVDVAPPERWQHGAEAYAAPAEDRGPRVQRVSVGIDALRSAGLIDVEDETAGTRFQRDHDMAFHGASARDSTGIRPEGGDLCSAADAHMAARVDAMSRYREAVQAVGMLGERVLFGLLIMRLGFGPLGEHLGWARQDVRGACVMTLKRLSEHYREADRQRGRRVRETSGEEAARRGPKAAEVQEARRVREPMVVISGAFRPSPVEVSAAVDRLRRSAVSGL